MGNDFALRRSVAVFALAAFIAVFASPARGSGLYLSLIDAETSSCRSPFCYLIPPIGDSQVHSSTTAIISLRAALAGSLPTAAIFSGFRADLSPFSSYESVQRSWKQLRGKASLLSVYGYWEKQLRRELRTRLEEMERTQGSVNPFR